MSFRPLCLTYRAFLHQVQFASHGQPANYISWTDRSEFGPNACALWLASSFYHLWAVCVVITLSADSPRASRMRTVVLLQRFHVCVLRVQELPLSQMASFGAILFKVKIAVPLENGKKLQGRECIKDVPQVVFLRCNGPRCKNIWTFAWLAILSWGPTAWLSSGCVFFLSVCEEVSWYYSPERTPLWSRSPECHMRSLSAWPNLLHFL